MSEDKSRFIEKIRKLFALASNNPSAEEAASAALQAQRLMAKYSIDPEDVEAGVGEKRSIGVVKADVACNSRTWRLFLANVIARAFRCELFQSRVYKSSGWKFAMNFYGYDLDAQAAACTFEYLYKQGARLAKRAEREGRDKFGTARGVFNSFAMGFVEGVESELEAQSLELMIVESEEVKRGFEEFAEDQNFSNLSGRSIRYGRGSAHEKGVLAGREAVASRRMTSGAPRLSC